MSNAKLTPDLFQEAVHGSGWSVTGRLQPLAGEGATVQPPTYAADKGFGPYNLLQRKVDGDVVDCVTLNSVGAEANAHEQSLEDTVDTLGIPQIQVRFQVDDSLDRTFSTAQLPHRCTDARLRDSQLEGVSYRKSQIGKAILNSSKEDMTGIFNYDPRSILFGCWDSWALGIEKEQRLKRGQKLTLSRLLTASIQGVGVQVQDSRTMLQDPLHFSADLPLKAGYDDSYLKDLKNKNPKPSEVGLSAVPNFTKDRGGVSMDYALYESVMSTQTLRGYRFPCEGTCDPERDKAARLVLAALALLSQCLRFESGFALRSGCDLIWADGPDFTFYRHSRKNAIFQGLVVSEDARAIYEAAVTAAKGKGLGWSPKTYTLSPSPEFMKRIRKNLEMGA